MERGPGEISRDGTGKFVMDTAETQRRIDFIFFLRLWLIYNTLWVFGIMLAMWAFSRNGLEWSQFLAGSILILIVWLVGGIFAIVAMRKEKVE